MGRNFEKSKVDTNKILDAAQGSQNRTDLAIIYKSGLHKISSEIASIFVFLRKNGVNYNLTNEDQETEKKSEVIPALNSIHNFQNIYSSLKDLGRSYEAKDSFPKHEASDLEAFSEYSKHLFTESLEKDSSENAQKAAEKASIITSLFEGLNRAKSLIRTMFVSTKPTQESTEKVTASHQQEIQVADYAGKEISSEEYVKKIHEIYQARLDQIIIIGKSMCFSGVISLSQNLATCMASQHNININVNSPKTCDQINENVDNALENCAFIFNMNTTKDEKIQEYLEESLKISYEINDTVISVNTIRVQTLFEVVVAPRSLTDGSNLLEGTYNGETQNLAGADNSTALAIVD